MKNLIYQFWEGTLTSGNEAGVTLMKEYADRIGVEHVFELNPTWPKDARVQRKNLGRYNPHYGAFKPIFDLSFDDYDNILFCDTDVVPVDICNENIFDEFKADLGICEEWMQPSLRTKHNMGGINNANDNRWYDIIEKTYHHKLYRDDIGRPRVFNSGVVLYSKKCRQEARQALPRFEDYTKLMARSGLPPFYQGDQNYLNAMLPLFDWQLMDYKWNSQIFFRPDTSGDNRPINDYREQPCFVHVQLRGADHYDIHRLRKVVND
jgi:hypothetical protein